VVGSLALAGIPIFAGFFSKDEILGTAFNHGYYAYYVVGVIVAFMTAFYTFRMVYMTFHGLWRGPAEAWRHVHESAATMVTPLVILSVPTILAGVLLGLPPEGGAIHTWLEEVFLDAEQSGAGVQPGSFTATGHETFQLIGHDGLLLTVTSIVAALGIYLAYRFYVRQPAAPARLVERIPFGWGPGLYAASVNKFYIDELYLAVFARGGVQLGRALWWFDAHVIDGAVNGTGRAIRATAGELRKGQSGFVRGYAAIIGVGVVGLLVWFVLVRGIL